MKPRKVLGKMTIQKLNQMARTIEKQGVEASDAVQLAADRYGLIEVVVSERVRLYRTKGYRYVACWTDFPHVADGEAGFDDQIELFERNNLQKLSKETDKQSRILDHLGRDTTWNDVVKRYKGKDDVWILNDLDDMYPGDDNEELASDIYSLLQ